MAEKKSGGSAPRAPAKTTTRAKSSAKASTATRAAKAPAKAPVIAARPVAKRTVARKRTAPTAATPGAVEQWTWHASSTLPSFTQVWSSPLVANMTDDNGDGQVDLDDIPDVIFAATDHILQGLDPDFVHAHPTLMWGILILGIGIALPVVAQTVLYGFRPRTFIPLDAGVWIVALVVMGAVIGAFG